MRRSGPEPDPEVTFFEHQFDDEETDVVGKKPHSGTWAETFETLGCGVLIVLAIAIVLAACMGLVWIVHLDNLR